MADYDADLLIAGDRAALEQMLDVQRTEMARLLDGLTEEQARRRLVPSLTTLLGLVKHGCFVERVWFHHRVARHAGHGDILREQILAPDAQTA